MFPNSRSLPVALVSAAFLAAGAHAEPLPASSYGRLPMIQDAALSPDGARLAMIVTDGDATALQIFNINTGSVERVLAPPEANTIRAVDWAEDDKAVYHISRTYKPTNVLPRGGGYRFVNAPSLMEYWRVGVLNVNSGKTVIMLDNDTSWANRSISKLIAPIEGDRGFGRLIGWGNLLERDARPRRVIFRVSLSSGKGKSVGSGTSDTFDFLLGETGEIVARVDSDERSNRWSLYAYREGSSELIFDDVSETGAPIDLSGLLPDGRIAVADRFGQAGRAMLHAVDPATGETQTLFDPGSHDVSSAVRDPWTRRVVGVSWTEDYARQHYFDADLQRAYESVETNFPGGFARLLSWSRDRSRFLVYGEQIDDAGGYYLYEAREARLLRIGYRYPDLIGEDRTSIRQAIKYSARDGVSVPAYLTLPAGQRSGPLPAVALVHGGPHARDTFAFDWWASFLASRGYAVLQVNYRGSTGYGYDWFNAGRGEWGDGVMQTDVEDGVDALVKAGLAAKDRVCIAGGSYGGYAALAGATLTPKRYACAISVNGVSDVLKMLETTEKLTGRRSISSDWWRLSIGDRRADRDRLTRISPARNAERVAAPVLLIHGLEDSVVPFEQSKAMAAALVKAGRGVRLVELKGDDHWLSSAATRTEMLEEIERFLAEAIGPGSVGRAAVGE